MSRLRDERHRAHERQSLLIVLSICGIGLLVAAGAYVTAASSGAAEESAPASAQDDVRDTAAPEEREQPRQVRVFVPAFHARHGNIVAGKAFVVESQACARPIILTALHLIGPSGGYDREVAPLDVQREVDRLALLDTAGATPPLEFAAEVIPIAEAKLLEDMIDNPGAGDVLALWAPESLREDAVPLSTEVIGAGEDVWAVFPPGSGEQEPRRHHARVTRNLGQF